MASCTLITMAACALLIFPLLTSADAAAEEESPSLTEGDASSLPTEEEASALEASVAKSASSPPPSLPPPGKCKSSTPNADTKDIFTLSDAEVEFFTAQGCSASKNDNFHPCSKKGSCTDCNQTCTPVEPGSDYWDVPSRPPPMESGCGKAAIIKVVQGDIQSCNKVDGPGKAAQGNLNANANGASSYYCAGAHATASDCCKACSETPDCRTWMLVVPNDAEENPHCGESSDPKWYSQVGCSQDVVTRYYGGCGWCFLHADPYCAPRCVSWGLTNETSANSKGNGGSSSTGSGKENVYWALFGRSHCGKSDNGPHFSGADGTKLEFNGLLQENFCLISDENLHMNMKMHGYYDDRTVGASILNNGKAVRTWMRELGFVWRSPGAKGIMQKHTLHLVSRSGPHAERGEVGYLESAALDGKLLAKLLPGGCITDVSGITLSFTGVKRVGYYELETYRLTISGLLDAVLKLRAAHPLLRAPEDAEVHFNILIESLHVTPAMHGVLGQTYQAGRTMQSLEYQVLSALLGHPVAADGESGLGYLDGYTSDYISSTVLSTDCKYSAFVASAF